MCFNQAGDISTQDGPSLKQVDKFAYLRSSVSSTEKDIDTQLTKAWTAIDKLSVIWKSDLTDKMKHSFFQAAVVSILLYGCTTWMLTKRLVKKLDGNYTRMLRAILNKSWWQHPTKHQLYGHRPPITKIIQTLWDKVGDNWNFPDLCFIVSMRTTANSVTYGFFLLSICFIIFAPFRSKSYFSLFLCRSQA